MLGACLAVLVASVLLLTRDLADHPAPAEASHLIVEAAASTVAFVASVWAASRFRGDRRRAHEPAPRRERERERRDAPRPDAAAARRPVATATIDVPTPAGRVGAGARRPEGRARLRIVPPPRE